MMRVTLFLLDSIFLSFIEVDITGVFLLIARKMKRNYSKCSVIGSNFYKRLWRVMSNAYAVGYDVNDTVH